MDLLVPSGPTSGTGSGVSNGCNGVPVSVPGSQNPTERSESEAR